MHFAIVLVKCMEGCYLKLSYAIHLLEALKTNIKVKCSGVLGFIGQVACLFYAYVCWYFIQSSFLYFP